MRLDLYLAEHGLCRSRSAAQSIISEGGVLVNGKMAAKASMNISDSDEVLILDESRPKYVGRGGLKLEKALEQFGFDVRGAVCIDIGASTGGFTDCMLQNGAAKVFAVDVGRDQLDAGLRNDSRVVSLEQTDIRDFSVSEYGIEGADFIGTDVSFISLRLILPHIYRLLKDGGKAAALIKPQFEAGRENLSKNGIVRSEKVRLECVENIRKFAEQCGFNVIGITQSPILGGSGNTEYLLGLDKKGTKS
ncbi:MAG: TlyA family RNA methyltransferase [Oscillospiraceae bacterium]